MAGSDATLADDRRRDVPVDRSAGTFDAVRLVYRDGRFGVAVGLNVRTR